jgi:hypothetical protein
LEKGAEEEEKHSGSLTPKKFQDNKYNRKSKKQQNKIENFFLTLVGPAVMLMLDFCRGKAGLRALSAYDCFASDDADLGHASISVHAQLNFFSDFFLFCFFVFIRKVSIIWF